MSYYDKDNTDAAPRVGRFPGPGLNSVAEYQQAGRPFIITQAPGDVVSDGTAAGTQEIFNDNKVVNDTTSRVDFPFITKKVTITNTTGDDLNVYFCSTAVPASDLAEADQDGGGVVLDPAPTARGDKLTDDEISAYNTSDVPLGADNRPNSAVKANGHYYTISNTDELVLNVKCKRIYLAGAGASAYSLVAELTNIVHPYNLDIRGIEGISGGTAGTVTS